MNTSFRENDEPYRELYPLIVLNHNTISTGASTGGGGEYSSAFGVMMQGGAI